VVSQATVSIDGRQPASVERPSTAEELATCLADAAASGLAVVPIGGGRALGVGGPLERFDLALETSGLDQIVDYSPADLTLTVEAGTRLERLDTELRAAGQFLPIDPFATPGHTVGGVLASGWTGPLRLRYGSPRDFLVGLRVALPDGRLARSGGRVVKNVSGYDLGKLHLGALGTLGVIVEASFKVFPRPLQPVTMRAEADNLDEAWELAQVALQLRMAPAALEMVGRRDGGWELWALLAGPAAAVERSSQDLGWPTADSSFWSRHAETASADWARIAVPPDRTPEILAMIRTAAFAEPGLGIVHWLEASQPDRVQQVRQAAESMGGSLVILAGSPDLKRSVGAWGRQPPTLELMKRLKQAFDPGHTLAPGRHLVG
jgi:glycolate oxidase FAD binding subunit